MAPWVYDHWIPNATLIAITAASVLAPLILLPVASGSLVKLSGGLVVGATVMTTRTASLAGATTYQLILPGSHSWRACVVIPRGKPWLIVLDSQLWVDVDSEPAFVVGDQRLVHLPRVSWVLVVIAWILASMGLMAILAMLALGTLV